MFVMRLSASGKAFRRAYLNEAQEAFLDGHVRAFEHFGGVPARIRYDNLKAAVVKVLSGRDRAESERFIVMRSHYGFDSFFCLPGIDGAHEKGGVEGEVGRFRRRALVPVPKVASMAELNELLDRDRGPSTTNAVTSTAGSSPLPSISRSRPRRCRRCRTRRSIRHGRCNAGSIPSPGCVSASRFYSVPVRYAGRRVAGPPRRRTPSRSLDGHRVVARPCAWLRTSTTRSWCWTTTSRSSARKPGALPNATALARARASGAFSDVHDRFWTAARERLGDRDGTNALIEVLLAHRQLPAAAVIAGMAAAMSVGSVDPAVVVIEARKRLETDAVVIPIGEHLARFDRPAPIP